MPGDVLTMQSLAQSNMPTPHKSKLRLWYEGILAKEAGMSKTVAYGREGVQVFRQGSESLLTGLGLGWLSGERGSLDTPLGPIDGWVAGLGFAAAVAMAGNPDGISQDARNVASNALAILAFRKMEARKKASATSSVHGEEEKTNPGEDPILAYAKNL